MPIPGLDTWSVLKKQSLSAVSTVQKARSSLQANFCGASSSIAWSL